MFRLSALLRAASILLLLLSLSSSLLVEARKDKESPKGRARGDIRSSTLKNNISKSITVNANGYERFNSIVEFNIEPTSSEAERSKSTSSPQIKIIEVDVKGRVLNRSPLFQVEKISAGGREDGSLKILLLLDGVTAAKQSRFFRVTRASNQRDEKPSRSLVQVQLVADYQGQESYRIVTPSATYYYHMRGAGFASLIDKEGKEWIGYRPGGKSAGEFRGIPNLGEFGHPGYTNAKSTLISEGPLKVEIYSESTDGKWACFWSIYPDHARMIMLKNANSYWFLYEGTPGGKLDLDTDHLVLSNGEKFPLTKDWQRDLPAPEWIYFADEKINRSLFVAHHEDDDALDQFWQMNGEMTVFGFGRKYKCCSRYLTLTPSNFTIGLIETVSYPKALRSIDALTKPFKISMDESSH